MQRRRFVQNSFSLAALTAVGGLSTLSGCATTASVPSKTRVLVVGGGYGGATAAKYVRLLSNYQIEVVMVEIRGDRARLAFSAPRHVEIVRAELEERPSHDD